MNVAHDPVRLRSGTLFDAVGFQDVADRGVGDVVADVR